MPRPSPEEQEFRRTIDLVRRAAANGLVQTDGVSTGGGGLFGRQDTEAQRLRNDFGEDFETISSAINLFDKANNLTQGARSVIQPGEAGTVVGQQAANDNRFQAGDLFSELSDINIDPRQSGDAFNRRAGPTNQKAIDFLGQIKKRADSLTGANHKEIITNDRNRSIAVNTLAPLRAQQRDAIAANNAIASGRRKRSGASAVLPRLASLLGGANKNQLG